MSLDVLPADTKVAVLGLGYVGLPLAHALTQPFPTVGFDIDSHRVAEIQQGIDINFALSKKQLGEQRDIAYSAEVSILSDRDIYIITAPTPIDTQNQPNLEPVRNACRLVAPYLKVGNIVIFESTVYPGATEEECVPILTEVSGLDFSIDFFVGYSPERINPGDDVHTLTSVIKVTSGSTEAATDKIDAL